MQVIVTTTLTATDHKPKRIAAQATGGKRRVYSVHSMPDDCEGDAQHAEAARRLADELNWTGQRIGGNLSNTVMVWVDTDPRSPRIDT